MSILKHKIINVDAEHGKRFTYLKGRRTDEYFLDELMDLFEMTDISYASDRLRARAKKGLNKIDVAQLRVLKRLISILIGDID